VSLLFLSAIFLVPFSFLKSGAHLVLIGIERPKRSRSSTRVDVYIDSCRERERERYIYESLLRIGTERKNGGRV